MVETRKVLPGLFVVSCAMALSACGGESMVKPEDLRTPTRVTCISLPESLAYSFSELGIKYTYRLNRGPYVSVKESDDGVYFRGPGGSVFLGTDSTPQNQGRDGGFWLPRNASQSPRIYTYFSASPVAAAAVPDNASCADMQILKDPATQTISVVQAASAGAAAGVSGRAGAPTGGMSYGQSAAGGAIGLGIVALAINADTGKISFMPPIQDAAFMVRLKERAAQAVPVQETDTHKPSSPAAAR